MNRYKFGVKSDYTGTLPHTELIQSVDEAKGTKNKTPLEDEIETTTKETGKDVAVDATMDFLVKAAANSVEEEHVEDPVREVQQPAEKEEEIAEKSPRDSDEKHEERLNTKFYQHVKMKSLRKTSNVYSFVYCEVLLNCLFEE